MLLATAPDQPNRVFANGDMIFLSFWVYVKNLLSPLVELRGWA
jgi:hypothetical protein